MSPSRDWYARFLRLKLHEGAAIAGMISQSRPKIYGVAWRTLRDHQAAEDIVQDVFLKACSSLPSNLVNHEAWLCQVARNLAMDRKRPHRRTARQQRDIELAENMLATHEASPSNAALCRNFRNVVYCPVKERAKALVFLADCPSIDYALIAEICDSTLEQVSASIARGRATLHKAIRDHCDTLTIIDSGPVFVWCLSDASYLSVIADLCGLTTYELQTHITHLRAALVSVFYGTVESWTKPQWHDACSFVASLGKLPRPLIAELLGKSYAAVTMIIKRFIDGMNPPST